MNSLMKNAARTKCYLSPRSNLLPICPVHTGSCGTSKLVPFQSRGFFSKLMTNDTKKVPEGDDAREERGAREQSGAESPRRLVLPPPAMAAIALYMVVLAGTGIVGVAQGHLPPLYLIFSAAFVTAALGLLLLLRWAWALTLGAVLLLASLFFWRFATGHALPYIVQGLLNLVFFLYLIRTEVREKLR